MNAVRRSRLPVSVFLTKGVRLQGVIGAFDNFSLELRRAAGSQLVYKHAISTVAPTRAPEGFELPAASETHGDGLQDLFLASAAREQGAMSLYLINGVMLEGAVAGFDQYCVLLSRGGVPQLVYKHAISTLQPRAAALAPERAVEEAGA